MAKYEVPVFGTLAGVKVVFTALSIAGPFAASMYADHGADVIWLEHVSNLAIDRTGTTDLKKKPYWLEQDRRNMRSMKLDFKTPEGREILCKILADTDIFLEASKGGAFSRILSDEEIWAVNPRCTILHLNGFGLTGLPEYVNRASYDTIAQAYGGMIYANSKGDSTPSGVIPYVADFYSGWACFSAGLMGYIKAMKTGKGDSVDISQVEGMIRCGGEKTGNAWNFPDDHPLGFTPGNFNSNTAGYNTYLCKDGNYILLLVFGFGVMKKMAELMGVEIGTEQLPLKPLYRTTQPDGQLWEKLVADYCLQHNARELEKELSALGIPAACVLSYKEMLKDPQILARDAITTVHAEAWGDQDIRVSNVFPRFKLAPGKIWKEAPYGGEDTRKILEDLGYSDEQIAELQEKKIAAGRSEKMN